MFFIKKKSYEEYRKTIPWKRILQVGYDKEKKMPIFQELTYDYFKNNLELEWFFYYNNDTINIACHFDNKKNIIYELNINGYDKSISIYYEFLSPEELLNNGMIHGKTIKEIWEDLEN